MSAQTIQHGAEAGAVAAKVAPPITVVGAEIAGMPVPVAIQWLTLLYLGILIVYQLWKWRREASMPAPCAAPDGPQDMPTGRRQRGLIERKLIAALSISGAGLVGIAWHEGYTEQAVIPVKGDVPTYGFGSTRRPDGTAVQLGDRITPVQALAHKLREVRDFEGAIKGCVTAPLAQHEFDAYVSLAYNIGPSAFCRSTLVRLANAQDYDGACRQILRWTWFQGLNCAAPENARRCGGLVTRRQGEYSQCMGGA